MCEPLGHNYVVSRDVADSLNITMLEGRSGLNLDSSGRSPLDFSTVLVQVIDCNEAHR